MNADTSIFDRTYGWGNTKTTSETVVTAIDSNGAVTTGSKTVGDLSNNNVANVYPVPAYFGTIRSGAQAITANGYFPNNNENGDISINGLSDPSKSGTTETVWGALYAMASVAGDGAFDRTWGFGDTVTSYRGKAGVTSQAAHFSSATSNYTAPRDTDSGATAPKYFEVSPGNGTRPAPSPDFSGIYDRTSSWGHTTGNNATTHIVWNGVTYNVPVCHD